MTHTPDLIEVLVARGTPVRRLRSPGRRAAAWLAGAAAVILVLALSHGVRPDLLQQLGRPWFVLGFLAAALTGALGALSALMLSLPDRSRAWALLPLPAAMIWIASVGVGCLTDWVRFDPNGFKWGDAVTCFGLLLATAVPLSAVMLYMLRRGGMLHPGASVIIGALAVAALSACALTLLHAFEASAMILLWNFGAAAVVLASVSIAGFKLERSAT